MTGRGQTVAIVDAYASPTMLQDANEFSRVTGNQPFRPGQYQQFTPSTYTLTSNSECGAQGWYGEETLDVESVHDMAPDANVHFVAAASCQDTDLAAADAQIVNNGLASIVSNSFGEPYDEAVTQRTWDQIFESGAAEGIGFLFSSGDRGYEDPAVEDPCSDKIQVDYPTSSPWVTSVGGTSLAIGPDEQLGVGDPLGDAAQPAVGDGMSWSLPSPPTYGPNTPPNWDTTAPAAAASAPPTRSRGTSGVWFRTGSRRMCRTATTPPTPMRVVPDVSALADPSTGMLVGKTTLQPNGTTYAFSLSRIGGTSVASPTFAGIEADAQQAAGMTSGSPTRRSTPVREPAFHDVTDIRAPGSSRSGTTTRTRTPKQGPLVTYLRAMGIDGQVCRRPARQRRAMTTRPASVRPTGTSSRSSGALT